MYEPPTASELPGAESSGQELPGRPAQTHDRAGLPHWSRRTLITIAAAVIAVAGIAVTLILTLSSVGSVTGHGTEEVSVSPLDGDYASQAYPDITDGAQITVINSSGTVIGTGTLTAGSLTASELYDTIYDFTVTVPAGQPRYGIQIGNRRGTVWFTQQQIQRGPGLCLGDGC